jgi:hypothetical protein
MVFRVPCLGYVCIPFLDSLPPVNRSHVRHKNGVFREERGHGGGIVVVDCLAKLLTVRIKLLDYFRIDRLFFLGEGWRSKADGQPLEGQGVNAFLWPVGVKVVCRRGICGRTARAPGARESKAVGQRSCGDNRNGRLG